MAAMERESINFKLPKTLTKALRTAARERHTTATDLVIQGLYHVLGPISGTEVSIETRLHNLEAQLTALANRQEDSIESGVEDSSKQRLSLLEQKTEAIAQRLAKIEGAISVLSGRSYPSAKRKSNNYHPPQLELQPLPAQNLASRLGLTASYLVDHFEKLSTKDFISWTRNRDPRSIGWEFHPEDGLYHPVAQ
ncbi:hypothetical protein NIES37_68790 [Tolypothrix tenuis PCC 7101]|uniref:Uncharacterized protein n=1 Tax=Tolypothrix tenuis PCC 7101 TaxID=231146 RepID=A0A1Z4NB05_9CYAN|nr:hypothetical protein NIES37_68790 [Tolypothrix tenuis PCC 7101]BAZ78240.1 hypothetical protein NIES50_68730 [Aulosira laxa NIES-50]